MNSLPIIEKKSVKILDFTTKFFQACKYTDILFNVK